MNPLTAAALLLAGYALGHLPLRGTPRAVRAWWQRAGALPGISRQSLYVSAAAVVLIYVAGSALFVGAMSSRENALESRLRQCEQRQRQTDWDQQQSGQPNPQGQRGADSGLHAKEVTQQTSTEQRSQQTKRHPAQLALACCAKRSADDQHDNVTGKRFGGHGAALCVNAGSIAQGGAA